MQASAVTTCGGSFRNLVTAQGFATTFGERAAAARPSVRPTLLLYFVFLTAVSRTTSAP